MDTYNHVKFDYNIQAPSFVRLRHILDAINNYELYTSSSYITTFFGNTSMEFLLSVRVINRTYVVEVV